MTPIATSPRPGVAVYVSRVCAECGGLIGPEQPLVRGPQVRKSWHVACAPRLEAGERRRRFVDPLLAPQDRVALGLL